jgi:hypothetical protein
MSRYKGKSSTIFSQESGPERDPSSHQLALWLRFPEALGRFVKNSLCDVQKIVPIYQTAVHGLVDVWTDAAGVDHGSTLLLGFGIQEVVALRTKVERCL